MLPLTQQGLFQQTLLCLITNRYMAFHPQGGGGGGGIGGSTGATDNAILRADGAGGSTLQSSGITVNDNNQFGGARFTVTSVNANYSALTTDDLLSVNCSGGAIAVTLPNPAFSTGKILWIKDMTGNAAANNITMDCPGKLIDGAATALINANWGAKGFYSDFNDWFII